jgi:predicted nucleic acid-binding protein
LKLNVGRFGNGTLLSALPIAGNRVSGSVMLSEVRSLAVPYRLTAYDAAYLETAIRLGLPLATLDDELIRACRSARVAIFG